MGFAFIGISGVCANNWKDFHTKEGQCRIQFPSSPQHIQQNKNGDQAVSYDVYIANDREKVIYFLLIASFPIVMNQEQKHKSLEGFFSGLLSNNPDNVLVDANLVDVQGNEGIDFQINNKDRFFQGRVVSVDRCLYLIASECNKDDFSFEDFQKYLSSFSLLQD
ncbi:MAG: hypothetical protein JW769_04730 [Parachlamydiales bacterium]|nr:hypothetical protein [Parachlamydiales bacterium]